MVSQMFSYFYFQSIDYLVSKQSLLGGMHMIINTYNGFSGMTKYGLDKINGRGGIIFSPSEYIMYVP